MGVKLNKVEADYLKLIYRLTVEDGKRLTSGDLARARHVKTPSAIDVLERLKKKGYVKKERYGPIRLTSAGERAAVFLMHVHRVLEVFFVEVLKVESDDACCLADDIDYAVNPELIRRLCAYLNRPEKCHHGRTIRHESCMVKNI